MLEFAALVFNSGLTKEQSNKIEMVQKKAFVVILGKDYVSYETAFSALNQDRLDTRRVELAYNFALKSSKKSPRHSAMFPLNPTYRSNTRNLKPFMEYQCHTSRYYNSPIPSLARLLNKRHKPPD